MFNPSKPALNDSGYTYSKVSDSFVYYSMGDILLISSKTMFCCNSSRASTNSL